MDIIIKDMTLREFAESLGVNKIVVSNRFYTFYGHPIIELPPHGDLIDRNVVKKFPIRRDHYDREHGNPHFIDGIESVMEYIDWIPAIIEAEVKE